MSKFPMFMMRCPKHFMGELFCVVHEVGMDDQEWLRIVGRSKSEWLEDISHEESNAYYANKHWYISDVKESFED